jgi:hypothetical protein
VDDLQLPSLFHLAFVRSPHPYARLAGIDAGPARARCGLEKLGALKHEGRLRVLVKDVKDVSWQELAAALR